MNIENVNLKEMQNSIEHIEKCVRELETLGAGIPVVEKNVRILLSVVHNLTFGIVDPALLLDE